MKPIAVSDADVAMGGDTKKLMPPYHKIPDEFKNGDTKWNKMMNAWFFHGIKNVVVTPKEGIDGEMAMRHVKAILASWEPKHQHKEAAAAFLLSEWLEDATYEQTR